MKTSSSSLCRSTRFSSPNRTDGIGSPTASETPAPATPISALSYQSFGEIEYRNQELEDDLSELRREHEEIQVKVHGLLTCDTSGKSHFIVEMERLRAQLACCMSENAALQEENRSLKSSSALLTQLTSKMREELAAAYSQVQQSREERHTLQTSLVTLQLELDNVQSKSGDQVQQLAATNTELMKKLTSHDKRHAKLMAKLESEIAALKAEKQDLQSCLRLKASQVAQLQQQGLQLSEALDQLRVRMAAEIQWRQTEAKAQQIVDRMTEEAKELQNTIVVLQCSNAETNKQLEMLTTQHTHAMLVMQQEVDKAKSTWQEMESKWRSSHQKISRELEEERDQRLAELEEARKEAEKWHRNLMVVEREMEEVRGLLKENMAKCTGLERANSILADKVKEAEQRHVIDIDDLKRQLQAAHTRLVEAERQRVVLQQHIDQQHRLDDQLQRHQREAVRREVARAQFAEFSAHEQCQRLRLEAVEQRERMRHPQVLHSTLLQEMLIARQTSLAEINRLEAEVVQLKSAIEEQSIAARWQKQESTTALEQALSIKSRLAGELEVVREEGQRLQRSEELHRARAQQAEQQALELAKKVMNLQEQLATVSHGYQQANVVAIETSELRQRCEMLESQADVAAHTHAVALRELHLRLQEAETELQAMRDCKARELEAVRYAHAASISHAEQLQMEVEALQKQVVLLNTNHRQQEEGASQVQAQLQQQVHLHQQQVARLEEEMQALQCQLETSQLTVSEQQQQMAMLKEEAASGTQHSGDTDDTRQQVEEIQEAHQQQLDEVIRTHQEQLEELTKALQEQVELIRHEHHQQLEELGQTYTQRIAGLEGELKTLRADGEQETVRLIQQTAATAKHQQTIVKITQELENERQRHATEMGTVHQELQQMMESRDTLRNMVETTRQEVEKVEAVNRTLREELAAQARVYEVHVSQLREELSVAVQQIAVLTATEVANGRQQQQPEAQTSQLRSDFAGDTWPTQWDTEGSSEDMAGLQRMIEELQGVVAAQASSDQALQAQNTGLLEAVATQLLHYSQKERTSGTSSAVQSPLSKVSGEVTAAERRTLGSPRTLLSPMSAQAMLAALHAENNLLRDTVAQHKAAYRDQQQATLLLTQELAEARQKWALELQASKQEIESWRTKAEALQNAQERGMVAQWDSVESGSDAPPAASSGAPSPHPWAPQPHPQRKDVAGQADHFKVEMVPREVQTDERLLTINQLEQRLLDMELSNAAKVRGLQRELEVVCAKNDQLVGAMNQLTQLQAMSSRRASLDASPNECAINGRRRSAQTETSAEDVLEDWVWQQPLPLHLTQGSSHSDGPESPMSLILAQELLLKEEEYQRAQLEMWEHWVWGTLHTTNSPASSIPNTPEAPPSTVGRRVVALFGLEIAERNWVVDVDLLTGKFLEVPPSGEPGVRVINVRGPAEREGILPDDIITHLNGHRTGSLVEFRRVALRVSPGDTVLIGLRRGGARYVIPLVTCPVDPELFTPGTRHTQKVRRTGPNLDALCLSPAPNSQSSVPRSMTTFVTPDRFIRNTSPQSRSLTPTRCNSSLSGTPLAMLYGRPTSPTEPRNSVVYTPSDRSMTPTGRLVATKDTTSTSRPPNLIAPRPNPKPTVTIQPPPPATQAPNNSFILGEEGIPTLSLPMLSPGAMEDGLISRREDTPGYSDGTSNVSLKSYR